MRPNKIGQVAKFHTPLPDERPDELYLILEIIEDTERPRADIRALNTGLCFPPVNTVLLDDLAVVEVDTDDLVGFNVTINKSDYSQVTGKVIKVSMQKIMLDLTKDVKGIETNVWLTVQDENGQEHTGTLFVN
ncbi:MAG: hypothetical protein K9I69_04195 [Ignavibacteriales bacterium]|nr:hypothetical protein [Ignavibacteriales bacterium]MCF8307034.1 hypothetical protein [Ignavibacteriales bacterium]MCF8316657.1 hypothetical protein [Ignavibacteriales bacterium]MCF8438313.1 hypothetical protein [Ignavibacteriales bacterium]